MAIKTVQHVSTVSGYSNAYSLDYYNTREEVKLFLVFCMYHLIPFSLHVPGIQHVIWMMWHWHLSGAGSGSDSLLPAFSAHRWQRKGRVERDQPPQDLSVSPLVSGGHLTAQGDHGLTHYTPGACFKNQICIDWYIKRTWLIYTLTRGIRVI